MMLIVRLFAFKEYVYTLIIGIENRLNKKFKASCLGFFVWFFGFIFLFFGLVYLYVPRCKSDHQSKSNQSCRNVRHCINN